jgi:anti-sigma factor RsiW
MKITANHVAPEEVMALEDGELTSAEAELVEQHMAECAECAAVHEEFRAAREALAEWSVPEAPEEMTPAMEERSAVAAEMRMSARPRARGAMSVRDWRLWAIGGGGAVAGVLALVFVGSLMTRPQYSMYPRARQRTVPEMAVRNEPLEMGQPVVTEGYAASAALAPPPASVVKGKASLAGAADSNGLFKSRGIAAENKSAQAGAAAGPMIARTVSLTILVKNVAEARGALDAILAAHHGYAAQLTISTPEAGARSFQSSLRIPAPELQGALEGLRALGRVQTETQSGEEVTQQHADLVARLTNARETEARLRQILSERTGKMQDVLDVEEKISETRGEIEQMEAEQKALEHRVDFATVELQLTEEYKAELTGDSDSAGTRVHNSFVAGIRHAGSSLLGLVLFLEEYGPVMLIWMAILGGPAYLVWRYRRARL